MKNIIQVKASHVPCAKPCRMLQLRKNIGHDLRLNCGGQCCIKGVAT